MPVDLKPIPEFPGYFASSDGKIYSTKNSNSPIERKYCFDKNGYKKVVLFRKGLRSLVSVHRLILETHVGYRLKGLVCRHLDGNKQNNAIANLCWGSQLDNIHDQELHGTKYHGARHHLAKLDDQSVARIRQLCASGVSQSAVARQFNVSRYCVWNYVHNKSRRGL